jgi:hypothetical protein
MGDGKADGVSMGEAGDHARMTHLMVWHSWVLSTLFSISVLRCGMRDVWLNCSDGFSATRRRLFWIVGEDLQG